MSRFKEKTMSNTVKSKVLEYIKANPTASYKEVAAACGTTAAYIYTVMPKKKIKVKKAVTPKPNKDPSEKKIADLLLMLDSRDLINQELEDEIKRLNTVIDYLEEKVIEYRANAW
jgi:hypothetical protein